MACKEVKGLAVLLLHTVRLIETTSSLVCSLLQLCWCQLHHNCSLAAGLPARVVHALPCPTGGALLHLESGAVHHCSARGMRALQGFPSPCAEVTPVPDAALQLPGKPQAVSHQHKAFVVWAAGPTPCSA